MTETTSLVEVKVDRQLALTEAMLLPAAFRKRASARRAGSPGACC
jgi:hypothetical protein